MTDRVYDREQLYREIWAEPITVVAQRYGVSDSALRKHCVKLGVPLPGAGHWARVRAGQKVVVPPLPQTDGRQRTIVREHAIARATGTGGKLSEALQTLPADRRQLVLEHCMGLSVPPEMSHLHELFTNPHKHGQSGRGDAGNSALSKILNLETGFSEAQRGRACRILSVLFGAFEHLGYSVSTSLPTLGPRRGYESPPLNNGIFVCLGADSVEISLREVTKRVDHEATDEEIARRKRDRFFPISKYDWVKTGRLHSEIRDYNAKRKNWTDGERERIEDRIGEIAIWVIDAIYTSKAKREEREEDACRWREAEHKRLLNAELKRQELQQPESLEQLVQNWSRAERVRALADRVESQLHSEEEVDSEVLTWLAWARSKADWLDPLVAREDEILGPSLTLYRKTPKGSS